ncbi:MAG: transglutaminase-like cysteine peptidase, partial [Hyphomicrobium sp.]
MKRFAFGVLGLLPAVVLASTAFADSIRSGRSAERSMAYMRVYGNAQPPYGFVRFCETSPRHCTAMDQKDVRFSADAKRLSELDEINRLVNATIEPLTDLELYGVTEHWTLPVDKGDCEDYALLKRKILIDRGWPASALLMTVVRDEKGDGHAVLTARTVQGDYILDNKIGEVRVWNKTPYEFVMRQSYLNPRVWVSLDP